LSQLTRRVEKRKDKGRRETRWGERRNVAVMRRTTTQKEIIGEENHWRKIEKKPLEKKPCKKRKKWPIIGEEVSSRIGSTARRSLQLKRTRITRQPR